jgi:hypothetical protein
MCFEGRPQHRQQFGRGQLPLAQRGAWQTHTVALEDRLLTVQWQMVGEGAYQHLRQQASAGIGLRQWRRLRRRAYGRLTILLLHAYLMRTCSITVSFAGV